MFGVYLPATMSAPLRPPPTAEQIELARMRMVHNVLPTLPLECTYPLLKGGPLGGSYVAKTAQWHEFAAAYGEGVARARRSVAVATPPLPHCIESGATATISAEQTDRHELIGKLLDCLYFNEAGKIERHKGEVHVLDIGAGAATHASIENAVLLAKAGAVYLHHPSASKTIVLVESGFVHDVMQYHLGHAPTWVVASQFSYDRKHHNVHDREYHNDWGLWSRACQLFPKLIDAIPTPSNNAEFKAMKRVWCGGTARADWSAVQMMAPHSISTPAVEFMYDYVCANPSVCDKHVALWAVLGELVAGAQLEKLVVEEQLTSTAAHVVLYEAADDIDGYDVKANMFPTTGRWRRGDIGEVGAARVVNVIGAERAFVFNVLGAM